MVVTELLVDCGIPQVCQQTLNFMFCGECLWSAVKTCYLLTLRMILPVEACLTLKVLGRRDLVKVECVRVKSEVIESAIQSI